jgi:hypothetical protein
MTFFVSTLSQFIFFKKTVVLSVFSPEVTDLFFQHSSATVAGNAVDASVQCVADSFQSASHDTTPPPPTEVGVDCPNVALHPDRFEYL